MSRHLGTALTRYVDGELDAGQREQVAIHLAVCALCRDEVDQLRALKDALRCEPSRAPDDLAARLLAMTAQPGQPALVPRAAPRVSPWAPAARRVAVGFGLVALGVGGAFLAAGPAPAREAPMDPTDPGLVYEHVSTANEVPFAGNDVLPVSNPLPGR